MVHNIVTRIVDNHLFCSLLKGLIANKLETSYEGCEGWEDLLLGQIRSNPHSFAEREPEEKVIKTFFLLIAKEDLAKLEQFRMSKEVRVKGN